MYADDLTVHVVINNDVNKIRLQNDLNNLLCWVNKKQFEINNQK